jgi:hypothetical protein
MPTEDEHTGPGHGELTLSMAELRADGSRLYQSWTVCSCIAPQQRARWIQAMGAPEFETIASAENVEAVAGAVLAQPGSIQYRNEDYGKGHPSAGPAS